MIYNRSLAQKFEEKNLKNYKFHADSKKYNTWKVGGEIECVIDISSITELEDLLRILKSEQVPFFLMGKGSNTLFPDELIRGIGVRLVGDFSNVTIEANKVVAGAGASMIFLATKTANNKLSGLEFASGIPGTVGGSIVMNAGANGRELSDDLVSVTVMKKDGSIEVYKRDEINFSYRHSDFMRTKEIVLFATFLLDSENEDESAKEKIARIRKIRYETQPYDMPCCGSVFKNPKPDFAGQIIEEIGLKGYSIGGACVSTKHANFIVNNGDAKANEIKALIELIKKKVKTERGIELQQEVRIFNENEMISWK